MIKDRLNICLLAAKITDNFSSELIKGAVSAAKRLDVNLTVFPGKYIGTQELNDSLGMHYEYQDNVLFDYAAKAHFDYVIAAIGTIGYPLNEDKRREFLLKFKGVPVLSVASDIDGYDCLDFDNSSGISDAVKYLAEQGRKHIGILAGERDNFDCNERYTAYRRSLAENGLDFRESYLVYCPLSFDSTAEAEKILDDNPDLDAVICVNDVIASVLYDVMAARGIEVGKDIAVVGFDDQPFAKELDPPLATIKADAQLMGSIAVEKAVNYLNKVHDNRHLVETRFIPRHSCFHDMRFLRNPGMMFFGDADTIKKNIKSYVSAIISDQDLNNEIYNAVMDFVEFLDEEFVRKTADENTVKRAYEMIRKIAVPGRAAVGGISRLYALHEGSFVWLMRTCRQENIPYVVEMYHAFNVKMKKEHTPIHFRFTEKFNLENAFIRDSLMFGANLRDSYADILRHLCNIGSETSYLYLLENPIIHNYGFDFPDDITWLFKSYSYGANTFSIPEIEQKMDTREAFRNGVLVCDRPRIIIAAALYTAETHYGLALFEPENDTLFEELELIKYQLSSAVRTLDILKNLNDLLNDVTGKNSELENETRIDDLTRVYNRRGFYAAAEEMIGKYRDKDNLFVVCYTDTDDLRSINESHGHMEGDFAIKLSSDCLRYAFGKSAVIGRMGGGEFAVLIRKSQIISEKDVISRKEKFTSDFNGSGIKPYEFSISFGMTEAGCSSRSDLESALERSCEILLEKKNRQE